MDKIVDAKRKKLNDEENQFNANNQNANGGSSCSANTAAFAGTSSGGESQPQMFKLNDDCFEHMFHWLSLEDLLVLRRTCKQNKSVVDWYINSKYPRLRLMYVNNFEHMVKSYQMQLNYFEWIKHLCIRNTKLTVARIDSIKPVLNRLESLELDDMKMSDDSYKNLLDCCTRLKYLSLTTTTSTRMVIGTGNKWLRRQYPTLEHIRIQIGARYQYPMLLTLFQRNPNIRTFSTDCKFLSMNHHLMVGSKLKFNRLNLTVDSGFDFVHNAANNLHEQDFYETLHLYVNDGRWWSEDESQNLWKLRNLEILSFYSLPKNAAIPVVESVKKLNIEMCKDAPPNILKLMATNFINLKQVSLFTACLFDVRSFVCHAPKLEQIQVRTLFGDTILKRRDFTALNEERKKLAGACKVTICVAESLFLKMNSSSKLNFSIIELKRIDFIEKEDLFDAVLD